MKKEKVFNPHLIRVKKIKSNHFVAFVTWNSVDFSEKGETERNAVYFLLSEHYKFLGISWNDIKPMMKQIGFFS